MVYTVSVRVRECVTEDVSAVYPYSVKVCYADAQMRRNRRIGVYVYFQGTCGRSVHRGRAVIMP